MVGQSNAWTGGAPLGGMVGPAPVMTVVPRAPGEARRRTGGMLAALGGATIVAGSFADWVRADISTVGIREGTGWRNVNGDVAHGPWFAAMGAVLVIIGACYLVGLRPKLVRWLAAALAIASVGLAIYELYDITDKVPGVVTSVQPGLWIVIVGAVVALAGVLATAGEMPAPLPIRTPPLAAMDYPAAPPQAGDPANVAAAPPPPTVPADPPSPPGPPAPIVGASVVPSAPPTVPVPPQDPTLLG
jgi:hypothetical protein